MARPAIRRVLRLVLNDETVALDEVPANQTVLDWLRLDRRLRGTKEGCAEGDCGACTVLVGRLAEGGLVYEPVNACIRLVASLDGCHVVTVEHLAGADGGLHPVQRAMVAEHGSQCGFCTPGIVMSLYGLWLGRERPDDAAIETALQGNLCRCTGYEAIVRAGRAMADHGCRADDHLVRGAAAMAARLAALADGARVEGGRGGDRFVLPADADDLADILLAEPGATIVAGATDVGLWVTKQMRDIAPVVLVGHLGDLRRIEEHPDRLAIGACVTYAEAMPVLARVFPGLAELLTRVGGAQVRAMGTIGGNIANGSPIGDMPPALIALGAGLVLRRGGERRRLPLEAYFLAYGRQDRRPGEFVEAVEVPRLAPRTRFAAYKVSKRRDEDIASVSAGIAVTLDAVGRVAAARIAYGGMAATPKRAAAAEAALAGAAWGEAAVERAAAALADDFTPIGDARASAAYRMAVARNLLRRFRLEGETSAEPVRLAAGRAP